MASKMILDALKWQQNPETWRRIQETTVKAYRRIVRMAKIQAIITVRKIKDNVK